MLYDPIIGEEFRDLVKCQKEAAVTRPKKEEEKKKLV